MKAKDGDTVKVHYTGKLENGEVFDTSSESQPLELTIGSAKVIPGFEKGIIGMKQGDTKTFTIPPGDGYGPKREELMVEISTGDFPDDIKPFVGQQLQVRSREGQFTNVTVADIGEETVTLDANHPLAGETLVFDVELIAIT
jgi:FKBP-type peptidyl-prolyl cis-trans isomerase 2